LTIRTHVIYKSVVKLILTINNSVTQSDLNTSSVNLKGFNRLVIRPSYHSESELWRS